MIRRFAALVGAGILFVGGATCTVEESVLTAEPSLLCQAGIGTDTATIITGHACVDACLFETAKVAQELQALVELLTPQCILVATDLGAEDTWSDQPTPVEVMVEACTSAADAFRDNGTAILCQETEGDACSFDVTCVTSEQSTPEQQAFAVLLEARLPGVLSACCTRKDVIEHNVDAINACKSCGSDDSVRTCVDRATAKGAAQTTALLKLLSPCGTFTIG